MMFIVPYNVMCRVVTVEFVTAMTGMDVTELDIPERGQLYTGESNFMNIYFTPIGTQIIFSW